MTQRSVLERLEDQLKRDKRNKTKSQSASKRRNARQQEKEDREMKIEETAYILDRLKIWLEIGDELVLCKDKCGFYFQEKKQRVTVRAVAHDVQQTVDIWSDNDPARTCSFRIIVGNRRSQLLCAKDLHEDKFLDTIKTALRKFEGKK